MPADARLILATRSEGKRRELAALCAAWGIAVESLDQVGIGPSPREDMLEEADTFEANALSKARWFHVRSGGRLVCADDSGLEVDALGGAPGVLSKRWTGRTDLDGPALDAANNAHLIAVLRATGVPPEDWTARYVCAVASVWDGGELVVRGSTEGRIVAAPRGAGGFGYDPHFLSNDLGAGMAEVSMEAKAVVSHRGRAFRHLLAELGRRGVIRPADGSPVAGG